MKTEWSDGRLRIRPFREDDVAAHFEAVRESIAEVSRWLPWCHAAYAIDESRAWVRSRPAAWEAGNHYSFVVEDEGGRFLGSVDINHINRTHHLANLGYWVRTSASRQGVATAAARLGARFAFEALGLHRVEILMEVHNAASRRVAERAGAHFEGTLRHRLDFHGKARDGYLFSLLPTDLGLDPK